MRSVCREVWYSLPPVWKFSVMILFDLGFTFRGIPDQHFVSKSTTESVVCCKNKCLKNYKINQNEKLFQYGTLKTNFACKKYLLSVPNNANRIALTKFPIPNHSIMIEKGWYENRLFCLDQIEIEFRFSIKCIYQKEDDKKERSMDFTALWTKIFCFGFC